MAATLKPLRRVSFLAVEKGNPAEKGPNELDINQTDRDMGDRTRSYTIINTEGPKIHGK